MQVCLKDLIKKNQNTHPRNCNLFDMIRFLTNWLSLLLVVIIPFMSELLHCSGSPQCSSVKVIQFSLWCSHRSHLQLQSRCCWATQVSPGPHSQSRACGSVTVTGSLGSQRAETVLARAAGSCSKPLPFDWLNQFFFLKSFSRYRNFGGSARNSYFTGVFWIESWSYLGWKTL